MWWRWFRRYPIRWADVICISNADTLAGAYGVTAVGVLRKLQIRCRRRSTQYYG